MISRPFEEITGKHSRFEWNSARQSAFEKLRKALLSAPVLRLADVKKPFSVETDASDFAIAGVLLQQGKPGNLWHPVAYASWRLSSAERNYTAGERETLALVQTLKCCRYLFGHFDVFTDNMAVVHLRTKPTLTKREARWVELLADFDFTVHHKPGRDNAAADALSRRPDLQPGEISVVQTELTAAQCNALEFALAIDDQFSKTVAEAYQHYVMAYHPEDASFSE